MIFSTVLGLAGFLRTRAEDKAYIDDFPFRLHYAFTTTFLFLSSIIIGLQDLVGKNIDCIGADSAVNHYCWITGTQLLVKSNPNKSIYQGIGAGVHYGDETCHETSGAHGKITWETNDGTECIKTHGYYQWIPYVLFLQGVIFYLPRLFWLSMEEGKMNSISEGIRYGTRAAREQIEEVSETVTKYLMDKEFSGHLRYGWGYAIAQLLNFLNVIFTFFFTDMFLDNQFRDLGIQWLREKGDSDNVLYEAFPRITTCFFRKYGSGGRVETKDYLCILAPNIVAEKIYLFLWFWLIFLGILSLGNLILISLMGAKSSSVRNLYLMRAVLNSRKIIDKRKVEAKLVKSVAEMNLGQFLFLYLLGRNVDAPTYERIIDYYGRSLRFDGSLSTLKREGGVVRDYRRSKESLSR